MRKIDIITMKACVKNKSSDVEDIRMDIVAKVIYVICKPLTHICNTLFRTGVFPSRMKIAKVMTLFKSGAKTDLTNNSLVAILKNL